MSRGTDKENDWQWRKKRVKHIQKDRERDTDRYWNRQKREADSQAYRQRQRQRMIYKRDRKREWERSKYGTYFIEKPPPRSIDRKKERDSW